MTTGIYAAGWPNTISKATGGGRSERWANTTHAGGAAKAAPFSAVGQAKHLPYVHRANLNRGRHFLVTPAVVVVNTVALKSCART